MSNPPVVAITPFCEVMLGDIAASQAFEKMWAPERDRYIAIHPVADLWASYAWMQGFRLKLIKRFQ